MVIARARSTSQGANRCQTATPSPDRPPAEPCFPCGPPLAARAPASSVFFRLFFTQAVVFGLKKPSPQRPAKEAAGAQQIIQLLMDSSNFGSELGRVAVFYTQSFIFSRVSSHFSDSSRLGKVTPNISKDGCDGIPRPNQGVKERIVPGTTRYIFTIRRSHPPSRITPTNKNCPAADPQPSLPSSPGLGHAAPAAQKQQLSPSLLPPARPPTKLSYAHSGAGGWPLASPLLCLMKRVRLVSSSTVPNSPS